MPSLQNVKQEAFCLNIIASIKTGWAQGECYIRAGYRASGRAADSCAARMLTRDNIRARIAELQAPAAKKASISVETLIDELDQTRERALNAEQLGTARQASMDKAKLRGLLVERVEVGGAGEFNPCETAEQVVELLIGDGDAHATLSLLDQMRAIVEQRIVAEAQMITVSEPQPSSMAALMP